MPPMLRTTRGTSPVKHSAVECGHERRSLASCGHVAGAQVRNDVDARELCDERGMVEL
mgnify:CR=1 FL=1